MTYRNLLATIALAVAALGVGCSPANATAFAGVDTAFWSLGFNQLYDPSTGIFGSNILPDGIDFSCAALCSDTIGLSLFNTHQGYQTKSLYVRDFFTLANTTDQTFQISIDVGTDVSAFNPGGSDIGASVSDSYREWASFSSSVDGPDPIHDHHSCFTGAEGPAFAGVPSSCGVPAPDDSPGEAIWPIPGPGQTELFEVDMGIELQTYSPLPEPITVSLFGAGLVAMVMLARRRR